MYRITNVVSRLGIVGEYQVRLYNRASGELVSEMSSGADGSYAFNDLEYIENGYFVVAFDHTESPVNAAISDLLTPVPMP
jgi:hypothetical protein